MTLPTAEIIWLICHFAMQAEADEADEGEQSDGEDFLLKGPRTDLELRCISVPMSLKPEDRPRKDQGRS